MFMKVNPKDNNTNMITHGIRIFFFFKRIILYRFQSLGDKTTTKVITKTKIIK